MSTKSQLQIFVGGGGTNITTEQITADQVMEVNHRYVLTGGSSPVSLTLPTTAAVGDVCIIDAEASVDWLVLQNTGQQIIHSGTITVSGDGNGIESDAARTSITLVCTTADTYFTVESITGTATNYNAPVAPLFKTNIQNGLPGILFSGIADKLGVAGSPTTDISQDLTLIAVVKRVGNGTDPNYDPLVCKNNESNDGSPLQMLGINNDGANFDLSVYSSFYDGAGGVDGESTGNGAFGNGTAAIYTEHFAFSTGLLKGRINGTEVFSNSQAATFDGSSGSWQIGGFTPTSFTSVYYSGYMFEIIMIITPTDLTDVAALESHLKQKWNVAGGSGTPMSDAAILALSPTIWLRSDTLSLSDGDAVLSWTDDSGSGNDFAYNVPN